MMNDVKCLLLLAKVYKSHRKEDVLETLNKVIDQQTQGLYLPCSDGAEEGRIGLTVWKPLGLALKRRLRYTSELHLPFTPQPLLTNLMVHQSAVSPAGLGWEQGNAFVLKDAGGDDNGQPHSSMPDSVPGFLLSYLILTAAL